ncbi:MAG: 3-phosphoshikimate 1-carboxyvinyltransferase, partial [Bacteroidota bacterium]
ADISYLGHEGFPPLEINGKELNRAELKIEADISSQFVSALLMIAPGVRGGVELEMSGPPVSLPYIDMTIGLMERCGIRVERKDKKIIVAEQKVMVKDFLLERDWSSAAFWYETAALSEHADLFLEGLHKESLQGDSILPDFYQNFGIFTDFLPNGIRIKKNGDSFKYNLRFDFTDHPDLAPALIVTSAALGAGGVFGGLKTLRIKESDRVFALMNELGKMGLTTLAEMKNNNEEVIHLPVTSLLKNQDYLVETYHDHRIAMAFAPLALRFGKIKIENPEVVNKSYPGFWQDLSSLGFRIS